jgi:hypothetical protein
MTIQCSIQREDEDCSYVVAHQLRNGTPLVGAVCCPICKSLICCYLLQEDEASMPPGAATDVEAAAAAAGGSGIPWRLYEHSGGNSMAGQLMQHKQHSQHNRTDTKSSSDKGNDNMRLARLPNFTASKLTSAG